MLSFYSSRLRGELHQCFLGVLTTPPLDFGHSGVSLLHGGQCRGIECLWKALYSVPVQVDFSILWLSSLSLFLMCADLVVLGCCSIIKVNHWSKRMNVHHCLLVFRWKGLLYILKYPTTPLMFFSFLSGRHIYRILYKYHRCWLCEYIFSYVRHEISILSM